MESLSMVLVMALWGGFFVVGKLAVHEVTPLVVGTWRFMLAAPFFVLLLAAARRSERLPRWRDLPMLLALGATGIFGYNWLAFEGMRLASASDGAMISPTLNPILTMIVAGWLFSEPITRARIVGILLAVLGEALVFQEALAGMQAHPERLWGDLFYLGSAVCWSAYTILSRYASRNFSPLAVSAYSSLVGAALLLLACGPAVMQVPTGDAGLRFWMATGFLAIGGTVVALLLWNRGLARLGAVKASSFTYLVPVFALVMSMVFLNERPAPVQILGGLLVLAGVAIANRPQPTPTLAEAA